MALGDSYLGLDQVDASYFLGDSVLDLEASVHLNEKQKLNSTGILVSNVLSKSDSVTGDPVADFDRQRRRRCYLNHLLMAPLYRTVSFVQMNHIVVFVAHYLHLNVTRLLQKPLYEHITISKGRLCLRCRSLKIFL
ncbi:hypothetical protein BpHYR1_009067 [Brachionus plicatilis]|uniref:Uncharacterized protein n=1 Tax=Brachionus plicatilis TaxID=10195 RepID=A0A3M7QMS7_BRAPC|nr:hypothetical protein BpHYR1_009067 [Brachionus plicatilis]